MMESKEISCLPYKKIYVLKIAFIYVIVVQV